MGGCCGQVLGLSRCIGFGRLLGHCCVAVWQQCIMVLCLVVCNMAHCIRINSRSAITTTISKFVHVLQLRRPCNARGSHACPVLLPLSQTAALLAVQLESGTVDDELAALKKGMLPSGSSNGPVAALPEGRPVKDAIDMELEELRKKARE